MKRLTTGFIICAVVLLAGCKRDSTDPVTKDVVLSVQADGLKVVLGDKDARRTFTVTAAEEVHKDIAVSVSTDAGLGKVSLESQTVTIPKGSKSASGSITFNTAAFAYGANEKIKLSVASEGHLIKTGSVTYEVTKSRTPVGLPVATFHCDVKEVFCYREQLKVPVTIKLDKAAEQYTPFTVVNDTDNTITKGAGTDIPADLLYIDEGEKELSFHLVFDNNVFTPGVTGVCHNRITSDYATIGDPSSVKFTVTGAEPNKAALSTDGLEVVVGDEDFEKTITVTLAEVAKTDAVFTVTVESEEGGFEIVDKTITIAKGEKTGSGIIRFLKKAYPIEMQTGTATVSLYSETQGVSTDDAGKLVLNIKGTGTAPMAYLPEVDEPVKIKVSPALGDFHYNFLLYLSEPLDRDVVIRVAAECDMENGYRDLSESITVRKGSIVGNGVITFPQNKYPYDTDRANVTLKVSSDDVIVLNSRSTTRLIVSGETVNPNKEDMKYKVRSFYDVYVGSTYVTRQTIYVGPEIDGAKNTEINTVDAVITGGKEGVDYEWDCDIPTEIGISQGYANLYVKVFPAAAGKTLKLEIMSDDATVSNENTAELNVRCIEWPPVTRSAPKVKLGTIYEDYGLVFKKLRVAENAEYAFGFPRREWEDYYHIQDFRVSEGENDVVMTLKVLGDNAYASRAHMAIYADFNNDGNFAGTGEKVCLAKVEEISVNKEKNVIITMHVPAAAASEFPVRIGTIISNDIAAEFADGYCLLPGMENMIQMVDFKFIKK